MQWGFCIIDCICIQFCFFKVYKSLWKYIGVDELLRLTASNILAMIIVMFLSQLYFGMFSLISLELIAGVYALIIMSGVRVLYRLLRRYSINKNAKEVKTIIIGAGDAGNLLLRELRQNDSLNYKIVGFIDDFKKDLMIGGYPILGATEDLAKIKSKYNIESALIAISHVNQKDLRRIYDECVNNGLDTKIMNFQFKNNTKNNSVVADIKIEDLLGRGEIHLDQSEISSYLQDQVVVVTGAGGSIGSELCRQIVKFQPRKLIMIDINENSLYMLEQEFKRHIEHGQMSQNIEMKSLIASIRDKKPLMKYLVDIIQMLFIMRQHINMCH